MDECTVRLDRPTLLVGINRRAPPRAMSVEAFRALATAAVDEDEARRAYYGVSAYATHGVYARAAAQLKQSAMSRYLTSVAYKKRLAEGFRVPPVPTLMTDDAPMDDAAVDDLPWTEDADPRMPSMP